eukprot:TRINITY_DN573_c0_g1_i1.p1 TRINITY_DN573_c0_g1~~TRINITY_DN573_c0_g1_i1.p1  ORF type:complete len:954 (-),score=113.17 TRINITY_DN573_c0_g1_i1:178-3039(-)
MAVPVPIFSHDRLLVSLWLFSVGSVLALASLTSPSVSEASLVQDNERRGNAGNLGRYPVLKYIRKDVEQGTSKREEGTRVIFTLTHATSGVGDPFLALSHSQQGHDFREGERWLNISTQGGKEGITSKTGLARRKPLGVFEEGSYHERKEGGRRNLKVAEEAKGRKQKSIDEGSKSDQQGTVPLRLDSSSPKPRPPKLSIPKPVPRTPSLSGEALGNQNFLLRTLSVFILPPSTLGRPRSLSNTDMQMRTVKAFLGLTPRPRIILLGNHPSFPHIASAFQRGSVTHEPLIDHVFQGPPLFHGVVARALACSTELAMIVNGDVVLVDEVQLRALVDAAYTHLSDFLITAPLIEIGTLPPGLSQKVPRRGQRQVDLQLMRHVHKFGRVLEQGPAGLWLWNVDRGQVLFNESMPVFPASPAGLDVWLAHAAVYMSERKVVEAGTAIAPFTLRHSKSWEATGSAGEEGETGNEEKRESKGQGRRREIGLVRAQRGKRLGGALPGGEAEGGEGDETQEAGEATPLPPKKIWLMGECINKGGSDAEGRGGGQQISQSGFPPACLVEAQCSVEAAKRNTLKSEEDSLVLPSLSLEEHHKMSRVSVPRNAWLCAAVSPHPRWKVDPNSRSFALSSSALAASRRAHSLEALLPLVADERKILTLVAVTGAYADMLMNFVCTLRRLGLREPLVAALDEGMFEFALTQGLAVYLERPPEEYFARVAASIAAFRENNTRKYERERRCIFGSDCFRAMTKLKSRAVLKVLKLGYHVLWSDVDIAWFRDPLPEMYDFGPGTFPVQSDEWNTSIPPNSRGVPNIYGTMNSGFYFARSEPLVIDAFTAIIRHAAERVGQSEQPSFYKVLCGENQELLVGNDECFWNGLRVVFLERKLHPNGKVFDLWKARKTGSMCRRLGCATLHNNWIKGRELKTSRFKRKYLWHWDEHTRICRYDWYARVGGMVKAI